MTAQTTITDYKVEIVPIFESLNSAFVIRRGGDADLAARSHKGSFDKDGFSVMANNKYRGEYDLVLKVGGDIDLCATLDKFGFSFVDAKHTLVRKLV